MSLLPDLLCLSLLENGCLYLKLLKNGETLYLRTPLTDSKFEMRLFNQPSFLYHFILIKEALFPHSIKLFALDDSDWLNLYPMN